MKKSIKAVLVAGAVVAMLANPIHTIANQNITHQVKAGDTYFKISQQYGVSLDRLLAANNANSTSVLMIGDRVVIPSNSGNFITYTVKAGDSLWKVSQDNNITISQLASFNGLSQNAQLIVGQRILVPVSAPGTSSITEHIVVRGETLWIISNKYGITVPQLMSANNLSSDSLLVGQRLVIPSGSSAQATSVNNTTTNSNGQIRVTYTNHIVKSGDDLWNISMKYGIPMKEILDLNGITERTVIFPGQSLRIPVYHIPVKSTVSSRHGELLDWWTEAQYLFPINSVAKITDFDTGRSFMAKRTLGAFHADCEPLTANDARIMKEIWGNNWSWATRAIIVEVNGRKIAASASAMPHDVQLINNNNFEGHFDIHFLNSTRHKDNRIDQNHQAMIKKAAGVQ